MFDEIFSIDNLPTLDLHGEIGSISKVKTNDFIKDNYKLKSKYIVIIHGKGKGIVKKSVYEALKTNKLVSDYKLYIYNDGCTIVKLKI
jgi:DNA mismatch repair protein MutS2